MGCDYQALDIKISNQTLDNYEKWWSEYNLIKSSVKRPINNSLQITQRFKLMKPSISDINTSTTVAICFPKCAKCCRED